MQRQRGVGAAPDLRCTRIHGSTRVRANLRRRACCFRGVRRVTRNESLFSVSKKKSSASPFNAVGSHPVISERLCGSKWISFFSPPSAIFPFSSCSLLSPFFARLLRPPRSLFRGRWGGREGLKVWIALRSAGIICRSGSVGFVVVFFFLWGSRSIVGEIVVTVWNRIIGNLLARICIILLSGMELKEIMYFNDKCKIH